MKRFLSDPETKRDAKIWLLILLVYHVVMFSMYALFLAGSVTVMMEEGDDMIREARWAMAKFSLISTALLAVIEGFRFYTVLNDSRGIERSMDAGAYSPWPFFKKGLPNQIFHTALSTVIQLPIVIIYVAFGYAMSTKNRSLIDKIYTCDMAFYLITDNAILGFLLYAVYLFFLMSVSHLIVIRILKKEHLEFLHG